MNNNQSLDKAQKAKLIARAETLPFDLLANFVLSGQVQVDELNMSEERKRAFVSILASAPNPQEQSEWTDITQVVNGRGSEDLLIGKLYAYINKWDPVQPNGHHLEEAKQRLAVIESVVQERQRMREQKEWTSLNKSSINDLKSYYLTHPNTPFVDEIAKLVWNMTDKNSSVAIDEFVQVFPNSRYANEAKRYRDAFVKWKEVESDFDINSVYNYINDNPSTPYLGEAKLKLLELKENEIHWMKENPDGYPIQKAMSLIRNGIITDYDLLNAQVVTPEVLERLKSGSINTDLPDVSLAIDRSTKECKEGYTDVYFFGIPSTGKTCVLMGLTQARGLRVNLASGGGPYAEALNHYIEAGITVDRTPGNFVATIEATIEASDKRGRSVKHNVNLVEMSGEEFATKIANNKDISITSFEAMGTGATELLKNNNRKLFFLIIDPTPQARVITINQNLAVGTDEEGNPIYQQQKLYVKQDLILQKMINLFEHPDNRDIMKKVDGIHIIMTKSDLIGAPQDRMDNAKKIFDANYSHKLLAPLIELGHEYNINAPTGFTPKLFNFTLGDFYLGGLYEYNSKSSDQLVQGILNSTMGKRKETWWDKLRKMFD